MALATVNYDNVETTGYLNIYSSLNPLLSSTAKVSPSFSINSDIPIVTIELSKSPLQTNKKDVVLGLVLVNINAINTDVKSTSTLGVLVESSMKSIMSSLDAYGLQYKDHKSTPFEFERGAQRLYGKRIVYQFIVR